MCLVFLPPWPAAYHWLDQCFPKVHSPREFSWGSSQDSPSSQPPQAPRYTFIHLFCLYVNCNEPHGIIDFREDWPTWWGREKETRSWTCYRVWSVPSGSQVVWCNCYLSGGNKWQGPELQWTQIPIYSNILIHKVPLSTIQYHTIPCFNIYKVP